MNDNNKEYRVLCFLDDDYGRDVEIVMPVVYYAEKYLGCRVEFCFVWDIHAIYRKKPDLVLIPNSVGSKWYFEIAQYAAHNGIKVFAMFSEGNIRTDGTFNYWGFNTDHRFYEEYLCYWNARTWNFFRKELPEYKDRCVLTGAPGFDRYKIYKFPTKEEYLAGKDLSQFKKVIGYAGWAFGKLTNKGGRKELRVKERPDPERFRWMKKKMYEIEGMLKTAIEHNPDTLFILKRHPNEIHPHITREGMNEMIRLSTYPNVLYIREKEDLHNIINTSDIWLAFRSTTVLEAWMLKPVPTLLLSPELDFKPQEYAEGCVVADTEDELLNAINEFYATGTIAAFDSGEKAAARKQLIEDIIGFGDGLNHIRTGHYLAKVLKGIDPGQKPVVRIWLRHLLKYMLMHAGKYLYNRSIFLKLPKFRKTVWIFDRFRLKNLPAVKDKYYSFLDDFYMENDLPRKFKDDAFWKGLYALQGISQHT